MMATGHATSGALVGLLVALAGRQVGLELDATTVVAGTVVCAGSALLPDIDHPSSTVARSLGILTRIIGRVTSWAADAIRDRTCGCCATPGSHGHRLLTHTAVGAMASGALVGWACWAWGVPAAAVVVGCSAALAGLGLFPARGRRPNATLLGLVAAGGVVLVGGDGWWWLGVAVALGAIVHSVGDGLTLSGVPLWWPLRIRGCRWQTVGSPRWLRFRTGGGVERIVTGAMTLGVGVAGWALWSGWA